MPTVPITDWGDAVFLAVSTALNNLIAAIPAIIGALLILAVGWILSNFLARLTDTILERVGADRLYAEHGGERVYGEAGSRVVPSDIGAELVRWLVRLVFLVAAANVLGLTQISELLNQVILWIPNLIVAAVILLIAPLIGRFLRGLIEVGAGQMGFSNASLLGRIAEVAVIAFAVIIAINQIGIAANLVNILFIGIVAAISLAFGLAFGLGGRDVAAEITRGWYASSQQAADKVRVASTEPGTSSRSRASSATSTVRRPSPSTRSASSTGTRTSSGRQTTVVRSLRQRRAEEGPPR
jgi:hypothetical protein